MVGEILERFRKRNVGLGMNYFNVWDAVKWFPKYRDELRPLGGGYGDHLLDAGNELVNAILSADSNNLRRLEKRFGDGIRDFALWVWNDIPSGLMPYAMALLLYGHTPEEIKDAYVELRR